MPLDKESVVRGLESSRDEWASVLAEAEQHFGLGSPQAITVRKIAELMDQLARTKAIEEATASPDGSAPFDPEIKRIMGELFALRKEFGTMASIGSELKSAKQTDEEIVD